MNGDVLEEVQKYGDYEAVISRKVTGDELVSVCIRHFLCVSCYFRVYHAISVCIRLLYHTIFLCIMLFPCVSCYFPMYHAIFLCIMLFSCVSHYFPVYHAIYPNRVSYHKCIIRRRNQIFYGERGRKYFWVVKCIWKFRPRGVGWWCNKRVERKQNLENLNETSLKYLPAYKIPFLPIPEKSITSLQRYAYEIWKQMLYTIQMYKAKWNPDRAT